MSTVIYSAIAVCNVANFLDTQDVAFSVHDFCVNNSEKVPQELNNLTSSEFIDEVEKYLTLSKDELTIDFDSEGQNYSTEIFDFLLSYFMSIQISAAMKIIWSIYNSRTGMSGSVNYYDKHNNLINVEEAIKFYLESKDTQKF